MRLSFLVPDGLTTRGGCKRIVEYAMRLGKRGHEVFVLTPDKVLPDWLAPYYDGFRLIDIEKYRDFRTDVAIATGGRAARRLGRMTRAKVKAYSVVMLESMNKPTEKHGQIIDRDRFLSDPYGQKWIYYSNSTWMKNVVEDQFKQKCHLVLAPPSERMKPSVSLKPEGKLWGLGYGGTSSWKGGQRTAEAIALAKKSLPNLEMIHYSQKSVPRTRVLAEHWANPKQDLLPQIYSSADVFIHSSRFEGFANTVAESMSCGTPVISYKTLGVEDLVIHNETGIIVEEFDVNHMARAIIRLLTDNALYTKLKVKCIEHMQQFNWEKTLSTLEIILTPRR